MKRLLPLLPLALVVVLAVFAAGGATVEAASPYAGDWWSINPGAPDGRLFIRELPGDRFRLLLVDPEDEFCGGDEPGVAFGAGRLTDDGLLRVRYLSFCLDSGVVQVKVETYTLNLHTPSPDDDELGPADLSGLVWHRCTPVFCP